MTDKPPFSDFPDHSPGDDDINSDVNRSPDRGFGPGKPTNDGQDHPDSTSSPSYPPPPPSTPKSSTEGKRSAEEAVPPKSKRVKRFFQKWLAIIVIVAVLVWTVWAWIALAFPYASSEKAGFVQEFRKEGWLCKTWEGQLVVSTMPGARPEIFSFTVKDDSLAQALQAALPQRIVLSYDQHRGVPSSCFGETQAYVTGFRTLGF